MKKIKKAIIPVAGFGTRCLPATKSLPKEMLPVFNKPAIQHVVEEAWAAGIESIIFVTSSHKSAIENHFDKDRELEEYLEKNSKQSALKEIEKLYPKTGTFFYTRQQSPKGLGHAILCARQFISQGETFAVLLPDEIMTDNNNCCLKEMVNIYNSSNVDMMIATKDIPKEKVSSYGIVGLENNFAENSEIVKINDMVEKPSVEESPSNYAIVGRYILHSSVFESLSLEKKGVGGEIQLTDAIKDNIIKSNIYAYLYKGQRFDCGNPEGLLIASLYKGLEGSKNKSALLEEIKKVIEENGSKN